METTDRQQSHATHSRLLPGPGPSNNTSAKTCVPPPQSAQKSSSQLKTSQRSEVHQRTIENLERHIANAPREMMDTHPTPSAIKSTLLAHQSSGLARMLYQENEHNGECNENYIFKR